MKQIIFLSFLFFSVQMLEAKFRPEDRILFTTESSIHAHAAKIHLQREQTNLAIEELKKALHDHPENRAISVKLAELHYKNEEHEKALELLLPFQALSTKKNNIYYFIGMIHDKMNNYKDAYLYYKKAFKLDPTLYKARFRIARLFVKKGLYFDAATHLKNLLEINPDYKEAQVEFEMVLKLIRENETNVFRRGNLVVTFPEFSMIRDLEEWYPYLQENIYYMQNALGMKDQVIWIKVVDKIPATGNPPAMFRSMENKIYLTVDTLKRKYTSLFTHELAYFFLYQIDAKKAPAWLKEGIALYFSQPNLLRDMNLRRLSSGLDILGKRFFADKSYLNFHELKKGDKEDLFQAFLVVKYMIHKYGWENLAKLIKGYEDGHKKTEEMIFDIFHIRYERLVADFDMYVITKHYFKS